MLRAEVVRRPLIRSGFLHLVSFMLMGVLLGAASSLLLRVATLEAHANRRPPCVYVTTVAGAAAPLQEITVGECRRGP